MCPKENLLNKNHKEATVLKALAVEGASEYAILRIFLGPTNLATAPYPLFF